MKLDVLPKINADYRKPDDIRYTSLVRKRMLIVGVPVIAVCLSLGENWFPRFIYSTFGLPSGYLASLFLGTRLVCMETGEAVIPLLSSTIRITQSCSGFGFFCILAAFVTPFACNYYKRSNGFLVVLVLPVLVYSIAIVTNASRIVCGYHIHCLSSWLLPANFQPIIHQAVGVTVFISVLVLLGTIWSRIGYNELATYETVNNRP